MRDVQVQRVCEEEGEAVPTTFVHVIELFCESAKIKRKCATISCQQMVLETELLEIRAAGRSMGSQITAAENQIKASKAQSTDA